MASSKDVRGSSQPQLEPDEIALLDLAADDRRDVLSLSDKEALILRLYDQIQEQDLEKAILEQGTRLSRQSLDATVPLNKRHLQT